MGSVLCRNNSKTMKDETVVVTGASRGLGRSLVEELAMFKANIIVLGQSSAKMYKVREEILEKYNVEIYYLKCDLSKYNEVEKCVKMVIKKFGKIDVFINNSAIAIGKNVMETSIEEFEYSIQLNLFSSIYTTKLVLPHMIRQKHGKLVFISSLLGKCAIPGIAPYVTSKFALCGFVEALQEDLSKAKLDGVEALLVCPGHINTSMFEGAKPKYKWLNPALDCETVAKSIVEELQHKSEYMSIPWMLNFVTIISKNTMPRGLFRMIMNATGATYFMDSFKGNKSIPHPESNAVGSIGFEDDDDKYMSDSANVTYFDDGLQSTLERKINSP